MSVIVLPNSNHLVPDHVMEIQRKLGEAGLLYKHHETMCISGGSVLRGMVDNTSITDVDILCATPQAFADALVLLTAGQPLAFYDEIARRNPENGFDNDLTLVRMVQTGYFKETFAFALLGLHDSTTKKYMPVRRNQGRICFTVPWDGGFNGDPIAVDLVLVTGSTVLAAIAQFPLTCQRVFLDTVGNVCCYNSETLCDILMRVSRFNEASYQYSDEARRDSDGYLRKLQRKYENLFAHLD